MVQEFEEYLKKNGKNKSLVGVVEQVVSAGVLMVVVAG